MADSAATRRALHQIAFFAVSPARYRAVGRMGLRATEGGFGTPVFDGSVARVDGDLLVFERGGNIATQVISTVRAASEFFGVEYAVGWFRDFHDPPEPMDPDTPLPVDAEASLALGEWFGFAFEALGRLRDEADGDDVTEIQLWPEHFDAALEMGDEIEGRRASYGASPGDDAHPTPYVYVSPWGEVDLADPYWNDAAFNGSSLGYESLARVSDPLDAAVEFLLAGQRRLRSR